MARQTLTKSRRFGVFKRDDWTCRYCGASPPDVKLVVDHVVPVVEGGTNDDANLITACEPCNQGKGRTNLEIPSLPPSEARRVAQEYMEQRDLAELATQAAEARKDLRNTLVSYWGEVTGADTIARAHLSRLETLCAEFEPETVFDWIAQAHGRNIAPWKMVQYINGIARNVRAEDAA